MNLTKLMTPAVSRMFALGSEFVRPAVFYRPASFSSSTGLFAASEISVACSAFLSIYRPLELGAVAIPPSDDKVYVRASELAAISNPGAGDYLVESSNSLRRDVLSARLDPSGLLWTLRVSRSLNMDWGDLSTNTDSEDRGDLTFASDRDDWGAVT